MSEGGDHVAFPWKNPTWDFAKPDNSSNVGDRLGKKTACSSSHAQTVAEKELCPVPTRKRSRDTIKEGEDKNGKGELAANGAKTVGESDHEIHIWTERERRKKMRNMFANLHALLPHIPPKADKSTIVDEAVNYIKNLENTLQNLQKQKQEKYHCTAVYNCEPSTVVNSQSLASDSREAFLASQGSAAGNLPISAASSSASSPVFRHPIAFQTWSSPNVVLNICGDEAMISVCSPKKPGLFTAICYVLEKHKIQVVSAQVSSDYSRSLYMIQAQVAGASDQQAEVLPVEEIFKQAATEIMVWTSP